MSKRVRKIALIGYLALSACAPISTAFPGVTLTEPPSFTLSPTETPEPFVTDTLTSPSTLEQISGGWNVFDSPQYDFSFRYPAVYDAGFKAEIDPRALCNINTGKDDEGNFNIWVGNIRIIVKTTEQSLLDFSDNYVKEMSVDWNLSPTNQITVGGVPALTFRYTHTERAAWGVKTYVIHSQDLIFFEYYEASVHIECAPPNTGYSEYWVYKQIIETWRFD